MQFIHSAKTISNVPVAPTRLASGALRREVSIPPAPTQDTQRSAGAIDPRVSGRGLSGCLLSPEEDIPILGAALGLREGPRS